MLKFTHRLLLTSYLPVVLYFDCYIKRKHNFWRVCDELGFKSKNLYNLANYYCRQHFFQCSKSLDLTKLYHATKNSDAYLALPTKVSKQIIKCLTWDH